MGNMICGATIMLIGLLVGVGIGMTIGGKVSDE